MKQFFTAIVFSSVLGTAALAEEAATQPANAESASEDCSKQVWPNFSPACLRNADRAINVRLVTTNRR
jgi:hypothetical protein